MHHNRELRNTASAEVATQLADRFQRALRAPIHLPAQDIFAAASIGIALSTAQTEEPIELLHKADLAMYRAKTNDKGHSALYDPTLDEVAGERRVLQTARERGEAPADRAA